MVSSSSLSKKKTLGRRKIEIKKIQNPNQLQSSFSKRRSTLFHKAAELCCLTGAQIAVLVTTPANKVFAFGHSSVDSVVDRYLAGTETEEAEPDPVLSDINSLGMEELEKYVLALENLRNKVLIRADELKMINMGSFIGVDELEMINNYCFNSGDESKMINNDLFNGGDESEMINNDYFNGGDGSGMINNDYFNGGDELEMFNDDYFNNGYEFFL